MRLNHYFPARADSKSFEKVHQVHFVEKLNKTTATKKRNEF